MLLAFDVGNTETTVGLFAGDRLEKVWRLTTTAQRTPDEWATLVTSHLSQAGHSTQEVRAAIVASVAPLVTQDLCDGVESATGRRPALVDARSPLSIRLDVDEPDAELHGHQAARDLGQVGFDLNLPRQGVALLRFEW